MAEFSAIFTNNHMGEKAMKKFIVKATAHKRIFVRKINFVEKRKFEILAKLFLHELQDEGLQTTFYTQLRVCKNAKRYFWWEFVKYSLKEFRSIPIYQNKDPDIDMLYENYRCCESNG